MWTLSDEKRDLLVNWIWAIAVDPGTKPAIAVKAFRALVEAAKLDLVAAIQSTKQLPESTLVVSDDDLVEGISKLLEFAPEEISPVGDDRQYNRESVVGTVEIDEVA